MNTPSHLTWLGGDLLSMVLFHQLDYNRNSNFSSQNQVQCTYKHIKLKHNKNYNGVTSDGDACFMQHWRLLSTSIKTNQSSSFVSRI